MARYLWLSFDEATVIAGLLWRVTHGVDERVSRMAGKYQRLLIERSTPDRSGDLMAVGDGAAADGAAADGVAPPGARLEVLAGRYMNLRRTFEILRSETATMRAETVGARSDAREARAEARRVRRVLHEVEVILGWSGPVAVPADDERLLRARAALRAVA